MKWKQRFIVFAISILTTVFTVTACSSEQPASGGQQAGEQPAQPTGTVTLYTSVPEKLANDFSAKFQEKYPGIQVNVYRAETNDVLAKLQTEKKAGAVSADVVWVADVTAGEDLKSNGLLMPYDSPEGKDIPADLKDPEGYYYGSRLINLVLAYNTKEVTQVPDSWSAFLDSRFAKKAVIPSANAGSVLYGVGTMVQSKEFGWDFFQKARQNGTAVVKNNNDAAQRVATGEASIAMVLDYMVKELKEKGSPIDYTVPKEGVLTVMSPIAIAKDSKHVELAKKFLDYTISKDGQSMLASQNIVPVRSDVQTPEGVPTPDQLKRFPGEAKYVTEHRDEIKSHFEEIFK